MWKRSIAAASIVMGLLAITGGAIAAVGSESDNSSTTSTSLATETSTPETTPSSIPQSETVVAVFDAGDAGTVTVARNGNVLTVDAVDASDGWESEIDQASGREVEVKFLAGEVRIDFNAELEDGDVRARVRTRIMNGETPPTLMTTTTLSEAPLPVQTGIQVIDLGAAGSITIEVTDPGLKLVSIDQGSGWNKTELEVTPTEIKVELEREGAEVEAEIELDDGELDVQIEQQTDNSDRGSDDDHDDSDDHLEEDDD